jgi:hypothetical protein
MWVNLKFLRLEPSSALRPLCNFLLSEQNVQNLILLSAKFHVLISAPFLYLRLLIYSCVVFFTTSSVSWGEELAKTTLVLFKSCRHWFQLGEATLVAHPPELPIGIVITSNTCLYHGSEETHPSPASRAPASWGGVSHRTEVAPA